jgi:hypothetical protein
MLIAVLTDPVHLGVWAVVVLLSLLVLVRDLLSENAHIARLMKFVWVLTVAYSGPLGLWVYWYSGRRQIRRDSIWRRAFRSLAHCYSGCGAGEIIGVSIAAGLLALSTTPVALITFAFAYAMGYGLTVGPLLEEGVGLKTALRDAFITETPSILVMEVTAIAFDLWLAGGAGVDEIIFWSGLAFSLSVGLIAAYPVNVLLIAAGIKEGMADPRVTSGEGHAHQRLTVERAADSEGK